MPNDKIIYSNLFKLKAFVFKADSEWLQLNV